MALVGDRHPVKLPPMISYAQNFEDVVLRRAFDGQESGFYVDVGAWHPERHSVTKYFYDRGWNGINIEPQAVYYELLCAYRPRDENLRVAISAEDDTVDLMIFPDCSAYSSTDEATIRHLYSIGQSGYVEKTQSKCLSELLCERGATRFDFLKVDVEGAEATVLQTMDFAVCRPRVVVIEALRPGTRLLSRDQWETLILEAGYVLALFDGINCFYAESNERELLSRLCAPANALDNYIPWNFWQCFSPEVQEQFRRQGFADGSGS